MALPHMPVLATVARVHEVIGQLKRAGIELLAWTKDGSGDSDKLDVMTKNGQFLIAVYEGEFDVLHCGTWTWKVVDGTSEQFITTVEDLIAYMEAYETNVQ